MKEKGWFVLNNSTEMKGFWSLSFPSQTTHHPFGHLICTPVSLLAATSYLNIQPSSHNDTDAEQQVRNRFSQMYVNQMMIASHKLYNDFFSTGRNQLMIQEIYPWIPQGAYDMIEAAGLIVSGHCNHIVAERNGEKDLLLMPLNSLLENLCSLSNQNGCKISIIVTTKGHTVCFMCSECGALFMFDPLPAMLCFVPSFMIKDFLMQRVFDTAQTLFQDIEYSALIMMKHRA